MERQSKVGILERSIICLIDNQSTRQNVVGRGRKIVTTYNQINDIRAQLIEANSSIKRIIEDANLADIMSNMQNNLFSKYDFTLDSDGEGVNIKDRVTHFGRSAQDDALKRSDGLLNHGIELSLCGPGAVADLVLAAHLYQFTSISDRLKTALDVLVSFRC